MNNNILNKLGITLNAMQEATADAVLHTGKDVVVMSPTGSGKTYAYLLPLIQRLDASSDALQAVVLVPGRELALQSANVLKDMVVAYALCLYMVDVQQWKSIVY